MDSLALSVSCGYRKWRQWILLVFLVVSALSVLKDAAQAQSLARRIPRVAQPPKLEDALNNSFHETGLRVTDFRQREPGDGTPVSQETTAYLSYDHQNLYVIFVCKDEPGQVRAHMAKREDILNDDQVAVYLDTYHDRRRAYVFATNPLGIQRDGILTEGQADDFSFDTLWYSEGRLTADGFIVRLAIPFKSLRFSDVPQQTWAIALGRKILRTNEDAFWPHISRRAQSFIQQLASVEGLEEISPGRNIQFIPYGIFTAARFLDRLAPGGPAFRTDTEARGGLDAKFILRDTLTLDIALNPDFSQVESDEPQVTINQRFEVRFPEKRPFFIENAGFFRTPESLVFSRRVEDPQYGVRLTGKIGRWALGALAIDDRAPGRRVPVTNPLRGHRAGIGIVRVQREFARQSTIGVLVTSHDFASSSSRVYALDTRLRLNPNWSLTGQLIGSTTRALSGARLSGPAYFAQLAHDGRHLTYRSSYLDRSPSFRSQLGFIPRVDIRQTDHRLEYLWRPRRRRVVSFGPLVFARFNWDRQGRLQDWVQDAIFSVSFTGQTTVLVSEGESFELFLGRGFRKDRRAVFFGTEWLKWLRFSVLYGWGTAVNFFPASGAPFTANSADSQVSLTLRPAPRIRFDQTYLFNRLVTRDGSTPPGLPIGAGIFNNHIFRSKLNYQLNRELSVRAILDYNAVLSNPALVAQPRAKRLTTDVLFTYLLNPGTALYVGYTDNNENLAINPTMPPTLQRTGSLNSTGRQVFVKFSYLLRF
jgi:hypothetical protein